MFKCRCRQLVLAEEISSCDCVAVLKVYTTQGSWEIWLWFLNIVKYLDLETTPYVTCNMFEVEIQYITEFHKCLTKTDVQISSAHMPSLHLILSLICWTNNFLHDSDVRQVQWSQSIKNALTVHCLLDHTVVFCHGLELSMSTAVLLSLASCILNFMITVPQKIMLWWRTSAWQQKGTSWPELWRSGFT